MEPSKSSPFNTDKKQQPPSQQELCTSSTIADQRFDSEAEQNKGLVVESKETGVFHQDSSSAMQLITGSTFKEKNIDIKAEQNKGLLVDSEVTKVNLPDTPHTQESSTLKQKRIDTKFLPVKFAYFVHNLRTCCYMPFLILIFTGFGLTKTQAGLIAGLRLIGSIIGNLFWGMVSDRSKRHSIIVVVQVVGTMLLMFPQPFLTLYFDTSVTCGGILTTETQINNNGSVPETNLGFQTPYQFVDNNDLFLTLLLMNVGATFFDGSLGNILDAVVMKMIHTSEHNVDFGRQRMFGTPSFVVATIIGKHLVGMAPKMAVSCYSMLYVLYAAFILVEMIILLHLLQKTKLTSRSPTRTKYGKSLLEMCLRPSTFLFFGTMFVNGVLLSAYISYFIPFLEEMEATDLVYDISFLINSIASLSGLAFSSQIINILGGEWNTFCLSIAAFSARFLAYSVIRNSWYILVVEPLHMLCYAVFLSAYVKYVKRISPNNILNTMYGISFSLWFGYGFIAGNIFGGYYYDTHGGRAFYMFQSLLAGVWCVAILVYRVYSYCTTQDGDRYKLWEPVDASLTMTNTDV